MFESYQWTLNKRPPNLGAKLPNFYLRKAPVFFSSKGFAPLSSTPPSSYHILPEKQPSWFSPIFFLSGYILKVVFRLSHNAGHCGRFVGTHAVTPPFSHHRGTESEAHDWFVDGQVVNPERAAPPQTLPHRSKSIPCQRDASSKPG